MVCVVLFFNELYINLKYNLIRYVLIKNSYWTIDHK